MTYLGVSLQADGCRRSELGRKIGGAWSDFSKLASLWRHTSLPIHRKVQIFQAVVTSRIMYGLCSAWWNVSDQRRLDGFQARCLRRIVGAKPSFVSRISNDEVRRMAGQAPYSRQLLQQQLLLYGKVARAPDSDLLRSLTFCKRSIQPVTDRFVRKVGRPRNEWATMLAKEAAQLPGGLLNNARVWTAAVKTYCAYVVQ
jgi:hypothetical protein